ncbi:MAG: hypothetical protein R3Y16_07825 [Rikenellaceae bacterium]
MKYIPIIIATIIAPSLFGQSDGVVAYWSFDNDSNNMVIDSSVNENHGESSGVTYD